jgi:hypothetical protein
MMGSMIPYWTVIIPVLAAVCHAHFILLSPISLGYDDARETEGPCGSFNPLDRSTGVTEFPLGGLAVNVITTHLTVTWEFNAALLTDVAKWVPLTPVLSQTGFGAFCEPQIPGNPAWVGLDAVLQVIQHGPDGDLYQVCKELWLQRMHCYSR